MWPSLLGECSAGLCRAISNWHQSSLQHYTLQAPSELLGVLMNPQHPTGPYLDNKLYSCVQGQV